MKPNSQTGSRLSRRLGACVVWLALFQPQHGWGQAPNNWIQREPVNVNLNAVAHGMDRFIAVGNYGYWFTSSNAQTWTIRTPLTDGHLNAIQFADGRFVAVGDGIYSTTDGVVWSKAGLSGDAVSLTDVATDGAGNWMAVGRTVPSDPFGSGLGLTFTSADGVSWSRQETIGAPYSIAFGEGQWWGAGGVSSFGGRTEALVRWMEGEPEDPPRFVWTQYYDEEAALFPRGTILRRLNGRFVLASTDFSGGGGPEHRVYSSVDGGSWSGQVVANQGIPEQGQNQARFSEMRAMTFGAGTYVGLSAGLPPSGPTDYWSRAHVMTSTDGMNWSFIDSTALNQAFGGSGGRALVGVTHIDGQFVAVGHRSPTNLNFATSADARTWAIHRLNPRVFRRSTSEHITGFAVGNGRIVGATSLGGAVVSEDHGVTWAYADEAEGISRPAYGNGLFVAVGGTHAHRSSDGFAWSPVPVPDAFLLTDVVYDGAQFVAVGEYRDAGNTVQQGIVSRSSDGAAWSSTRVEQATRIQGILHGNGVFLARLTASVAGGTWLLVSADAVAWTPVAEAPFMRHIAFGGGRFLGVRVITAASREFYTSVNGTDWTLLASAGFEAPFFDPYSLSFVNSHFVLSSDFPVMFLEEDRWVDYGGPSRAVVAFHEDTYVAGGQSSRGIWSFRIQPPEPPLTSPALSIQRVNGDVRLEWDAPGFVLESAPGLHGPWNDRNTAASPFQFAPSLPSEVFRLKQTP